MASVNENISTTIHTWLKREVFQKKLISPGGIVLLLSIAVISGYFAATSLFFVPLALAVALIGIIIIYYCIFKPLFGYYIVTFISFFLFLPNRIIGKDLPLSSGAELLILFLFIGTLLLVKSKAEKKRNLVRTIISIALMINAIYIIMEAFNPNIDNLSGWIPSAKRYLACVLVYVIAYRLMDTVEKIKYFLNFWIIFSFIAAVYGCIQQWFGYLPFEMRYINSVPGYFDLIFQGGQLRKFSFLSDVATFGILSGTMAVLTILLALNETQKRRRYILLAFTLVLLLGMAYSGTRTTNILLPAGIAIYGFVTIRNKTTLITLFVSCLFIMAVLFAPIHNNLTLNRIRSTFDSKEESLNLRNKNRHYIQPYIYSHPMGGGLATTGLEGLAFYPTHPLANFPPDSGYLKTALEQGWIGLIIYMFMNLVILYEGIYYYFRMRNAECKKYLVVILATVFPIIVAQYSQMSIGPFPTLIYFFSCLSIMKRLKELDDEKLNFDFLKEAAYREQQE